MHIKNYVKVSTTKVKETSTTNVKVSSTKVKETSTTNVKGTWMCFFIRYTIILMT